MAPTVCSNELYLDLIKNVLLNTIYGDPAFAPSLDDDQNMIIYDQERRSHGRDWPSIAHTMVGLDRLNNVHECLNTVVLDDNVPGDFIETGAWRGGVCIFMRAFMKAHGCEDRTVWVADSFKGLPDPTKRDTHYAKFNASDKEKIVKLINDQVLGVTIETVKDNFLRYGLLDPQVRFLPGWFKDTLPNAPIEKLAILRLDGDRYESTLDSLNNLYHKVSLGGFIIIDDYALPGCRSAVHEFREAFNIKEKIKWIDNDGAYWRKTS